MPTVVLSLHLSENSCDDDDDDVDIDITNDDDNVDNDGRMATD
jgi:hypothetical protein